MVAGPCSSKALAASCKKPGPSYARTCESPYAGVDIPHRRDIRRGDSTDSVTGHSCAGGRRYHEDANHVNHHAKEHDVNYLEIINRRRSVYTLTDRLPIGENELVGIVEETVVATPSPSTCRAAAP